jgi:DNA repair exonuclease SbcCD ATPase subunit
MSAFNNGTVALGKKVADMEKKMKTTEERLHTVEDLENKSAMRTAVRLRELEKENVALQQQVALLNSLLESSANMHRDHVEDLSIEIHTLKQEMAALKEENEAHVMEVADEIYRANSEVQREHLMMIRSLQQQLEKIDPPINEINTQNAEAPSNGTGE